MSENSAIEWTDHTFNPWWGCTKISPACDFCYAEVDAKRYGHPRLWDSPMRRIFGEKHWNLPRRYNRGADAFFAANRRRQRVFCASMADVFDKDGPQSEREKLWQLIRETPNLDWLLLTKRIGNAVRMLPEDWGDGYPNVWLGATIANQEEAERDIPKLLWTPARVRFLSCEPLLGMIALDCIKGSPDWPRDALRGTVTGSDGKVRPAQKVDWVIVGGESGPKARKTVVGDIRMLKEQCEAANVPVFVKQLGARPADRFGLRYEISDRKGKIMEEWPADLRVRQFPRAA